MNGRSPLMLSSLSETNISGPFGCQSTCCTHMDTRIASLKRALCFFKKNHGSSGHLEWRSGSQPTT